MKWVRRWSVTHSRWLERVYEIFEPLLVKLHPLWDKIGYSRIEKPVGFVEKQLKGFMFDCQMCGQCILHSTGMTCPMNCPKNLRNGPCGGVRTNGHCEVIPELPCVWVQAWERSQVMTSYTDEMLILQPPVNRALNFRTGDFTGKRPPMQP